MVKPEGISRRDLCYLSVLCSHGNREQYGTSNAITAALPQELTMAILERYVEPASPLARHYRAVFSRVATLTGVLDCGTAVMYVPEKATTGSLVSVETAVTLSGLRGDHTAIVSGSE